MVLRVSTAEPCLREPPIVGLLRACRRQQQEPQKLEIAPPKAAEVLAVDLEHVALAGLSGEAEVTPIWALSALILMTIPSLMVFLSLALAARINRWTNIIVAVFYILVAIGNPIGETWGYIWFGSAVEIVLLALVVWYSWKWPKQEA